MRCLSILVVFLFLMPRGSFAQTVNDDFEGSGTISTWFGDDCGMDASFANPYQQGINTSAKVLKYQDTGGAFANVRFDIPGNFDFSTKNTFALKIYVPSSGLTGNQGNQVSLKLQDGNLAQPWTTQSEIIKSIALDVWQEVTFDFENDIYVNLNEGSPPPIERTDFNRVVIQVNGENNTDHVLAHIDDLDFYESNNDTVFDNLVWSDEFNDAGVVDGTKWFHQTQLIAGDSWANNEQQHYTNRSVNSYMDNGTLKLVAKGETFSDQGVTKQYTSARLNSKFAFTYGRVEVRAKLPSIAGTWPAIWLLGKNINEDGAYWDNQGFGNTFWPWCGEIDIMEPDIPKTRILATWHWNNGSGYQTNSNSLTIANSDTSQNFHIYALEWDSDTMKIYLDNILVNEIPTFTPFDNEFFILLNVAMGGDLGGTIASGFDQDVMEIDYVRVYQESSLSSSEIDDEPLVLLYPNPTTDALSININNTLSKEVILHILDINGRIISKEVYQIINKKVVLDTRVLRTGLYFVNLEFDNGMVATYKLIKQ